VQSDALKKVYGYAANQIICTWLIGNILHRMFHCKDCDIVTSAAACDMLVAVCVCARVHAHVLAHVVMKDGNAF